MAVVTGCCGVLSCLHLSDKVSSLFKIMEEALRAERLTRCSMEMMSHRTVRLSLHIMNVDIAIFFNNSMHL